MSSTTASTALPEPRAATGAARRVPGPAGAPRSGCPSWSPPSRLVAADHPDARLTLAGTGPLEDDLRSQVTRLGLDDRVSFPGFVDAAALLGRAHVMALLSVWENCSYALLDALAHRVGVVASPVGANPEMVPADCLVDPPTPERSPPPSSARGSTSAPAPSCPPTGPTSPR